MLQVDNLPSTTGRITRRVDVIAPLYVGGLPSIFKPRAGIVSMLLINVFMYFYVV